MERVYRTGYGGMVDTETTRDTRTDSADRTAIERKAARVLGDGTRFDGMTDAAIKRAVVVKVHPAAAAQIDAYTDGHLKGVYLNSRFDYALQSFEEELSGARGDVSEAAVQRTIDESRRVADEASRKFQEEESNAWRQTTTPAPREDDASNDGVPTRGPGEMSDAERKFYEDEANAWRTPLD